jgi:predicted component of viral defense system (DUF524 family)
MTTPLNRLARHLLTDLEQLLTVTSSAEQERQALHLITEAFTVAAPLIKDDETAEVQQLVNT